MIDIARDIAARRAVDSAVLGDLVEVAVAAPLGPLGLLGVQDTTLVFGDATPLLDRPCGEQAQPRERATDAERSMRHSLTALPCT